MLVLFLRNAFGSFGMWTVFEYKTYYTIGCVLICVRCANVRIFYWFKTHCRSNILVNKNVVKEISYYVSINRGFDVFYNLDYIHTPMWFDYNKFYDRNSIMIQNFWPWHHRELIFSHQWKNIYHYSRENLMNMIDVDAMNNLV